VNPCLRGIPFRFETLSKNAVEEPVRLKEKHGGKVTAILFGNYKGIQVMKEAYAMGVDEGFVITGYQEGNVALTARVLAAKISQIPHDIVLLGNQSADSMSGLLGGKISAILGLPYVSNALKLEASGQKITVESAGEAENMKVEADLPAVVSVSQEINEPRFPPVMQIIQAGRKKMNVEQAQIRVESGIKVLSRLAPKSERKKVIFDDMDKGAQEIAKVIKEVTK